MSYLTSRLLIWIAIAGFLFLVNKMQHGNWPSEDARNFSGAFRELLLGRRVS